METPTLIYCAGGNPRFDSIALQHGFRLGARLPGRTVYHSLFFADQDWRDPDRASYMAALAEYRPAMATVLDWERPGQLPEVLDWAEEVGRYVQRVVIIPKVLDCIGRLPRRVGDAEVVLGFSVPTRYAGTPTPVWEFVGWPIHLLGGSPHAQMRMACYLRVVSVDGNMPNLMATRHCRFWVNGTAGGNDRYWQQLESGFEGDVLAEAFRRSCQNIVAAWVDLGGG
jgi:hypothetical protein